jgi:hypothetical protein
MVEACIYPGRGRLVITGVEPEDPEGVVVSTDTAKAGSMNSVLQVIFWLCIQQGTEWFKQLPCGHKRLDLKTLVLRTTRSGKGQSRRRRTGRSAAPEGEETLVDLHLHLPRNHGSWACGLAIVAALVELMRGSRTKHHAMYAGGVLPSGSLAPAVVDKTPITRDDFNLLITTEHPNDERAGFPGEVPAGMTVVGFSHAKDAVEYMYKDGGTVRDLEDDEVWDFGSDDESEDN